MPRDPACQVPDAEELADVDGATLKNIVPIDVHQAARSQVQTGSGNDAALDCHIIEVMILEVCGGLDLDQTPSAISAPLQDVRPQDDVAVLECTLVDRWDRAISG